MKFFDRDWMTGELTDDEYEARNKAYYAHFSLIRALLPPSLVELSQSGVLHDGLIESVRVDNLNAELRIRLLGGNLQVGYRALHLRYEGMELANASKVALQQATGKRTTEFLYDELDLWKDGRFEHRMLLWPHCELSVVFRNFDVVSQPRVNRQRHAAVPTYKEIG